MSDHTQKLFPHGLLPRYTRTIVATDLASRVGMGMGSRHGADALVDDSRTVIDHYIVIEPVADLQQSGKATLAAASRPTERSFGTPKTRKAA